MTTVQVWTGVDTRGVASLNVISDSRVSWGPSSGWDQGRKIFYCRRLPHVFAYWGDVLFPALALAQLTDQIDQGIISARYDGEWNDVILEALDNLFEEYPVRHLASPFTIIHLGRHGEKMNSKFYVESYRYPKLPGGERSRRGCWVRKTHQLDRCPPNPQNSQVVLTGGSGARWLRAIQRERGVGSSASNTSRIVFANFTAWLDWANGPKSPDPFTGGAPQMCRLIRFGAGEPVGIIYNKNRYFAEASTPRPADGAGVGWHNQYFEIVDPKTRKRLPHAQPHLDLKA